MSKDFSKSERAILLLFPKNALFIFQGKEYRVQESDKPRVSEGECKTDIYISAIDDSNNIKEFKISYKKSNADFVENKITAERAEQIFGAPWLDIVSYYTKSIAKKFEEKQVIFAAKKGRTDAGSFTLGWKFELLNKTGGVLSSKLDLATEQVEDIYAGFNQTDDKRNAIVNKKVISNSGIANFMLIGDNYSSAQQVIDAIIPIVQFVNDHPSIYFACKALNYRSFVEKYDGNRALAVMVDWYVNDKGQLDYRLDFDHPLTNTGDLSADHLKSALSSINAKTTNDLTHANIQFLMSSRSNYLYEG